MGTKSEHPIIFFFSTGILLLLALVVYHTTSKAVNILILRRTDYLFTHAKLDENVIKKYGDHAKFSFKYDGQVLEGSDRGLLWSSPGDIVYIYLNKKNFNDNGIVSQLVSLLVGQWLLFLGLVFFIIRLYKGRRKAHT